MNRSDISRFDPLQGGCYPGGKSGSGVAQRIINLMPPHQVYIEPFLGGGSVLRYKLPAQINIGIDRDPTVIERWHAAAPQFSPAAAAAAQKRDSRRSLATQNSATPQAMSQKCAAHPDAAPDPAALARGTRSRPGPTADLRDATRLRDGRLTSSAAEFHGAGLCWKFLCVDGIEFLRNYPWTGRELVYCDPPYLHATRRDLKLYSFEMDTQQHTRLLITLRALPCPVMISGYRSERYNRALRAWHALDYRTMTRRGVATETLWCNFAPPSELHDYRYLGQDRRERERIKRLQESWRAGLLALAPLERKAMLAVLNASASTAAECAGAQAPSVLPSNYSSLRSPHLNSQGLG